MGAEDADGLARLDEQRLVVAERAQLADDRVERLPGARRAAGAAVDDEVVGPLGDVGVEVVHQHPQRRLLRPALARELGAAGRAHLARALHAAPFGRVEQREARRVERVAGGELGVEARERRAGRVRARRVGGVVAEHADREGAPQRRRAAGLVQGEHVEGDRVAGLELPADDLVRGAVGLDVGDVLELALVEDERRLRDERARHVPGARRRANPRRTRACSRAPTGSTGIQNETFWRPSTQ